MLDKWEKAKPPAASRPAGVSEPVSELGEKEINAVFRRLTPTVARCFDRYHIPGTIYLRLSVRNDGSIASCEGRGPLAGTPEGDCVVEVTRRGRFPSYLMPGPVVLEYPITFRIN